MKREHGSVLTLQWWPEQVPGSGQVVDLLCDLGQAGSPLYTFPHQALLCSFIQSQAIRP